jgi:hypothetical protein
MYIKLFTRKSSGGHQAKRRKEEKTLSPRNRKACHSVSTALLVARNIIYKESCPPLVQEEGVEAISSFADGDKIHIGTAAVNCVPIRDKQGGKP